MALTSILGWFPGSSAILLAVAVTGCASSAHNADRGNPDHLDFNADEIVFRPIRAKIESLEARHAPAREWAKVADDKAAITSAGQLSSITAPLTLSSQEQKSLVLAYRKSASVMLYGFEANYHALVFFDSLERPLKVVKW